MSLKEYHKSLDARKFYVGWVLHIAKFGGVSQLKFDEEFCEKLKFVVFEV